MAVEVRRVAELELPKLAYEFAEEVPALDSVTLQQRAYNDGTIEAVRVRIYQGPALDLRIDPYILRHNNRRQNIIEYVGKQFVDGDDDHFTYAISIPIRRNELLVVQVVNLNDTFDYDFRVKIEVDHAGGVWRWPQPSELLSQKRGSEV